MWQWSHLTMNIWQLRGIGSPMQVCMGLLCGICTTMKSPHRAFPRILSLVISEFLLPIDGARWLSADQWGMCRSDMRCFYIASRRGRSISAFHPFLPSTVQGRLASGEPWRVWRWGNTLEFPKLLTQEITSNRHYLLASELLLVWVSGRSDCRFW